MGLGREKGVYKGGYIQIIVWIFILLYTWLVRVVVAVVPVLSHRISLIS